MNGMSKRGIVRLAKEVVAASWQGDLCPVQGGIFIRPSRLLILFNAAGRRKVMALASRPAENWFDLRDRLASAIRPELVGYIIALPRPTDGWVADRQLRRFIGVARDGYYVREKPVFVRCVYRSRTVQEERLAIPGGQFNLLGWLSLVSQRETYLRKWMLASEPEGLQVLPVSPDGTEQVAGKPVTEGGLDAADVESLLDVDSDLLSLSPSPSAEDDGNGLSDGDDLADDELDCGAGEEPDSLPERSSGEERPKGTDEVRPAGAQSEDSSYHGGDGSSGEVDDSPGARPSSTDSQSSQTSASTDSKDGDEASRTPARDPRPKEGKRPRSTGAQGESPDANPTVQGRDLLQGGTPLLSDEAGRPVDAWDSDEALTSEEQIELRELAGVHASSREDKAPQQKGNTVQLFEKTELDRYRLLVRQMPETRKVRYLLSQLVRMQIGAGTSSLRVDGKRLVTEIVSRRYSLSRIHKRNRMPGVAFLFVDTSGSMPRNSVGLFLGLAQVLSEKEFGGRLAAFDAPNGVFDGDTTVLPPTGEKWVCPREFNGSAHAVALEYARRGWGEPRLLIWFTDNHAAESAVQAAKDLPEALHIYLDVFGAKDGVRWGTKTWRRQYGFPDEMVFVQGVGDPAQVAQALEMILRGK